MLISNTKKYIQNCYNQFSDSNAKKYVHNCYNKVSVHLKNIDLKSYINNIHLKPWQKKAIIVGAAATVTLGVGCYFAGGPTALYNTLKFSIYPKTCSPLFSPDTDHPFTLGKAQADLQKQLSEIKQAGSLQTPITTCVDNVENDAILSLNFRISDKSDKDSWKIHDAFKSSMQNVYACFDITSQPNSRDHLHANVHFFKKIPEVCK